MDPRLSEEQLGRALRRRVSQTLLPHLEVHIPFEQ